MLVIALLAEQSVAADCEAVIRRVDDDRVSGVGPLPKLAQDAARLAVQVRN